MKTFLNSKLFLLIIIAILLSALVFEVFFDKRTKIDSAGSALKTSGSANVELKTFAFNVKEQLDSILRQKNENTYFKLDEAEIEIYFVIKNPSAKSGGMQYEILTADDKNKYEKESVHKMNLHFKFSRLK